METDELRGAVCGNCGYVHTDLERIRSQTAAERTPCPTCGSTAINWQLDLSDQVTLHSSLKVKAKEPGRKKPAVELRTGDDLHRKSGRWMKLVRRIDRKTNRYTEKVEDPETGNVIHESDEPLTDHRGHGSDKP